jgi:hypothetical protein
VALGLASGWSISKEINQAKRPVVETSDAIFLPEYEEHTKGVDSNTMSDSDFDIWFIEHYSNPFLQSSASTIQLSQPEQVEPKMIDLIQQKDRKFAVGEIMLGDKLSFFKFIRTERLAAGVLLGQASLMDVRIDKNTATAKTHIDIDLARGSRRHFIHNMFAAGAGALVLPDVTEYIIALTTNPNVKNTLNRILIRLNGIANHLAPERTAVFYRNALISSKLLALGSYYHSALNRKPRIVYEVGAAHSGIEDFLLLGEDFCNYLITNFFSKDDFTQIVALNGGVDNVAGIRVFDFKYSSESKRPTITDQHLISAKLKAAVKERIRA